MKYDYTKEFAMMEKIPNLTKTFSGLKPVNTAIRRRGDKFSFLFYLFCGTLLTMNYMNIDFHYNSLDYSNGFRVLPDYLTGTLFFAYRKERKNFILY